MADQPKAFFTKAQFSKLVEQTAHETQLSYMDTIIHLCEKHNIELEDARKYVSPVIKGKLEAEARQLNFLPKMGQLPVD